MSTGIPLNLQWGPGGDIAGLRESLWTVTEWYWPPLTLVDGRPMSQHRGTVWRWWPGGRDYTVSFGDEAKGEIG